MFLLLRDSHSQMIKYLRCVSLLWRCYCGWRIKCRCNIKLNHWKYEKKCFTIQIKWNSEYTWIDIYRDAFFGRGRGGTVKIFIFFYRIHLVLDFRRVEHEILEEKKNYFVNVLRWFYVLRWGWAWGQCQNL